MIQDSWTCPFIKGKGFILFTLHLLNEVKRGSVRNWSLKMKGLVIVSNEDIYYYCNFFTTVHLMSIITRAHNGSFSGHFPLCRARCPGPKFATENKSVAWQWSIWSSHITIIMETNNGPGTGARARPGHVHESGQFNYLILWIEELSQYLNHH